MAMPVEIVRQAFVLKDDPGESLLRSEKLSEILRLRKLLETFTSTSTHIYIETTTQQKLDV